MSSVDAKGDRQCFVVAATSAKVFSGNHLPTIRVKLINAVESSAAVGEGKVPLQLAEGLRVGVGVEITNQEYRIGFVRSLPHEPQEIVRSGLRAANAPRDVCWERAMMIDQERHLAGALVLQSSIHS